MGDTPKIPRSRGRSSLSLSKRLKRISPNTVQSSENTTNLGSPKVSANTETNDVTPPHKKINLDDSCDDSPFTFDDHSPTAFLSQSFGSDSPDVSWRWTKDDNENRFLNNYADSGFSSNSSSSMDSKLRRSRTETRLEAYWEKRLKRKRAKEVKLRKAERARVETLLRERIAGLESQFSAEHNSKVQQHDDIKSKQIEQNNPNREEIAFDDFDNIFEESTIDFQNTNTQSKPEIIQQQKESLNDFFNDSDTDCLLVQATQQLESSVPELSQTLVQTQCQDSAVLNQQASEDKRSSLYMKFLEDDEDEFFVSLDDSWLEKAAQSVKPRSPFQRYKSMPASTKVSESSVSTSFLANQRDNKHPNPNWKNKNGVYNPSNATSSPLSMKSIKRHASSHTIVSPSSTNYRARHLPSRK